MKKKLIIISTLLLVLFIFVGCSNKDVKDVNEKGAPKIELNTYSFDLGTIDPVDGIRTENFTIKNVGDAPLKINYISTSCACTQAESEKETINPGDSSNLKVSYDPSVHKDLVGKLKRVVYINTNDPLNEEIELVLTGNQLARIASNESSNKDSDTDSDVDVMGNERNMMHDHNEDTDKEYAGLLKNFEISPPSFYDKIVDKENIKILDVREDFEYEENHLANALLLSVNKINQNELDKLGLKKDDEIIVYCRSGKRSAKAYEILHALGYTNVKSMYGGIVHWMEDEFPVKQGKYFSSNLTTENNQDVNIVFSEKEYDFGEIKQFGGVVNHTFVVTNNGTSNLIIKDISTSCGCTTANISKKILGPNETAKLTVFFDPNFHEEPKDRFSRTVFLETNDLNNPEVEVKIYQDILEGQ